MTEWLKMVIEAEGYEVRTALISGETFEARPVQYHLGSRWLGNHGDISTLRAENSGATLQGSRSPRFCARVTLRNPPFVRGHSSV